MKTKSQKAYEIAKADDYLMKVAKLLEANHIPDSKHKKQIQDLRKLCDNEIGRLDDMEEVESE